MTVEDERLKLLPHSVRLDEAGRRIVKKPDGSSVIIPQKYQRFFDFTNEGVTLAQMARFAPSDGQPRFSAIAKYLGFLHDHQLLADKRARKLAEALKPDYVWRESIAFETIFSLELLRARERKPASSPVRTFLSYFFFCIGFLSLGGFVLHVLRPQPKLIEWTSLAPVLLSFLFSFSVTRSLRALLQYCAMIVFGGSSTSLRLRADCVSISLGTDDLSLAPRSFDYLLATFGILALMTATPAIAKAMLSPEISHFAFGFTCLVLLSDLSPFRRSPLTEWFRALYNYWDRSRTSSRDETSVENLLGRIQLVAAVTWLISFCLVAYGPGRELWRVVRIEASLHGSGGLLSAGIIGLALIIILFSYIDDIASQWAGESSEKIRRMWRRKGPSQVIDEAIRDGHSPSREDLEKLPVLRQIDRETRQSLLARSEILHFREGETVLRQGDGDRSLLIVLSGRLAVAKTTQRSRRKIVAFLDPGSVFGEMAFFIGHKRTADVIVMEEARVLSIPHDSRMSQINKNATDELQFRIWFLQSLVSNSTWKEIPADAMDALVFAGTRKTYRAGERIIHEGEVADAFYFMIQGQASVTQNTVSINKVKAGDAFGEIALLNPHSLRTATIIADTDLIVVKIETEKFWHLLGSHLPLGLEIERLAMRRLEKDRQRN